MNNIDANIARIDQEARRLGIDLGEQGVNKRTLTLPGGSISGKVTTYEFTPNGQYLRAKRFEGTPPELHSVETIDLDHVIGLFQSLSGTVGQQ